MIEILSAENYLIPPFDKKQFSQLSMYKSCFRKGILLSPKLLYCLLKGSYWGGENKQNFLISKDEIIDYKCLRLLLNRIKLDVGKFRIFITPHIFTKIVNELRNGVKDKNHYKNIWDKFIEEFSYIREEELKKEEILSFKHFTNRYCGLSETSIILLKERLGQVCIIDMCNSKTLNLCGDDFLFVDFTTLRKDVIELIRREEIV